MRIAVVMGLMLLGFAATPAGALEGQDAYVVMIHATFEPRGHQVDGAESGNVQVDQAKTGTTYATGAAGATRDGDYIVFHAIPYLASTVSPVVVRNPFLDVDQYDGWGSMKLKPNLPSDQQRICHVETSWAGHEGPVDACTAYRAPVAHFQGMPVVTLSLHFDDASGHREIFHSFPAHFLLHMAIEGAPIDMTAVGESVTEGTPMVIQNDYVPYIQGMSTSTPTSWRCVTELSSPRLTWARPTS
jgi:hypothetical protein